MRQLIVHAIASIHLRVIFPITMIVCKFWLTCQVNFFCVLFDQKHPAIAQNNGQISIIYGQVDLYQLFRRIFSSFRYSSQIERLPGVPFSLPTIY